MPARSLTESKSVKMLVFADSGWGKTRLLGGSPGGGLIIRPPVDFTDSILPGDKSNWKEWIVDDWHEMEEVYETLRMEPKKYPWVWFDSASGYQEIGLDDLWNTIVIENPKRKRYGMDKGDYWINMQRMGRWIRNIVTLSDTGAFNLGITSTIADMQPSEDEEVPRKLMPWIQGKNMAPKICGYMNVVAFGEQERGKRVLHFNATERFFAKDQFDMFPNYKLVNPTMAKIMQAAYKSRPYLKGSTSTGRKKVTGKSNTKMRVVRGRKAA